MTRYAQHVTAPVPQTEQAHPDQKPNNAGGFSFTVDCWKRLDRWLILGSEGGTYYVNEKKLTLDNAAALRECLAADGPRTVARIVEISDAGRAPKNDPAIFALALAASDKNAATRAAALAALPAVCRIGTHLFHFAESVNALRGWGRGLRTAIAKWYTAKAPDALAYQMLKYQQRDGWSHKDVLRLCHAELGALPSHQALARWAIDAGYGDRLVKRKKRGSELAYTSSYSATATGALPKLMMAYEELKAAKDAKAVASMVREYNFTHEMVPNDHKGSKEVWEALLERMPLGALVRNLGKMTSVGLIAPMSDASRKVAEKLADRDAIRKARLHPIALLSAMKVYEQGHGEKGSLTWTADQKVVDALDSAFYLAFETIEPTGKAILLALDVSGSMSYPAAGVQCLSCRDVTAAMAMVTARTEKEYAIMGFSNRFMELKISPKQRLTDVMKVIDGLPFESTDCSLPMLWAMKYNAKVDAFVVMTDSETYAGAEHPYIALERYRQTAQRPAKLIVCATAASSFTIANPADPGMLDVSGFSTDTPAVLADFIRE